jgi:hypothetical protein
VRRCDGFTMHDDWCLERALAAIRSAAELPGDAAIADALAAAIGRQQERERERVLARKRKGDEEEAAVRQGEEAVISVLRHELQILRAADPWLEPARRGGIHHS